MATSWRRDCRWVLVSAAVTLTAAREPFGWIVLRHVKHGRTEKLEDAPSLVWLETCTRLRRWFASDPILVLDNLSNRSLYPVGSSCPQSLAPCTVVFMDEFAAGELLPYHLMAESAPFERAVYIHDSTMPLSGIEQHAELRMRSMRDELANPRRSLPATSHLMSHEPARECATGHCLPVAEAVVYNGSVWQHRVPTAVPLWAFMESKLDAPVAGYGPISELSNLTRWKNQLHRHSAIRKIQETINTTVHLVRALRSGEEILKRALYEEGGMYRVRNWPGALGAMAAFDVAFARMLMHDLNARALLPLITSRKHRMAIERVLGLVLSWGGANPLDDLSLRYASHACLSVMGMAAETRNTVKTGFCLIQNQCQDCPNCATVMRPGYKEKVWTKTYKSSLAQWSCVKGTERIFLHKCCMRR